MLGLLGAHFLFCGDWLMEVLGFDDFAEMAPANLDQVEGSEVVGLFAMLPPSALMPFSGFVLSHRRMFN